MIDSVAHCAHIALWATARLPACATLGHAQHSISLGVSWSPFPRSSYPPPPLPGADGSNGVDLYSSDGSASRVDIYPVVSSYQDHSTGERFHLHPELVDKSGEVSTVLLCHHCDNKSMPPRMSIASNIDFGLLSRIDFRLETPSALEKMLMSKVRLFFPLSQLPAGASNLVSQL